MVNHSSLEKVTGDHTLYPITSHYTTSGCKTIFFSGYLDLRDYKLDTLESHFVKKYLTLDFVPYVSHIFNIEENSRKASIYHDSQYVPVRDKAPEYRAV